jgi:hypothetical protein
MATPHDTRGRRLQPSKLRLQDEGLRGQIDLSTFRLARQGYASIDIVESILAAEITRTIDGASTLTVTVSDADKKLSGSGQLANKVDTKVDGLWFRLVAAEKMGPELTLTFEDREVALLRTYSKKLVRNRSKMTRAQFVKLMVEEVKETKINYVCPELLVRQPIKKKQDKQERWQKDEQRDYGFPDDVNRQHRQRDPDVDMSEIRVKGELADKDQLNNMERVLDVGVSMGASRKILVCSIMCITQESTAHNLKGGDRDSVGLFQQRPSQGWPASRDIERDASEFFKRIIALDKKHTNLAEWELIQGVQRSANGKLYDKWLAEAKHTVDIYGVQSDSDLTATNNMNNWREQDGAYLYTRGTPDENEPDGWKNEDSWDCMQRLANEVNWRAFCVSGTIYFASEKKLFKSRARIKINEKTDGIDWIDWDINVGQEDDLTGREEATVTVTAHVARWEVPPGALIWVNERSPVEGKWLVTEIRRPLFSNIATITCKKPRPKLPEPAEDSIQDKSSQRRWKTPSAGSASVGKTIDRSGGARSIVDSIVAIAEKAGGPSSYVGSSLRAGDKLPSGSYSDHAQDNQGRAARDIGFRGTDLIKGPPKPELDEAVVAIGDVFGKDYVSDPRGHAAREGQARTIVGRIVDTFDWEGYRIQIIWRTPEYGGHMGHIHAGARDLNVPSTSLAKK